MPLDKNLNTLIFDWDPGSWIPRWRTTRCFVTSTARHERYIQFNLKNGCTWMIHRLSNRHTMTRDVMLACTEILNIDIEHCIWIRFLHSARNDIISIHTLDTINNGNFSPSTPCYLINSLPCERILCKPDQL